MERLNGRLVTPRGLVAGDVVFDTDIRALEPGPAGERYVLPGFIDVHVHGGGGSDTMDGAAGVRRLGRFHLSHGTTSLLPTTITSPPEAVLDALEGVRRVIRERDPGLPSIPGTHLEGPFISPGRLGAQPPHALVPTPELLERVLAGGVVRVVTLAPEVAHALEAARAFARAGVRVSIGHTRASYEETRALIEAVRGEGGVVGFTHLFNAMGGLAGRAPGAVGAALADPEAFAELIFDGHHVHQGSFLAALAAKGERLLFVTDAIRASGLGDGASELGGQPVLVDGGAARLADGTLAGSVLTLDRALRNAVAAGLLLERASDLVSGAPARYLGLRDRGALEPGRRADLVVLSSDLEVLEVYLGGRRVEASPASPSRPPTAPG